MSSATSNLCAARSIFAYQNHLGVAHARLGRVEPAIASFRLAVGLDPRLPEAHYNWGKALRTAGRFEEAALQYRAALASAPNLHKAHYNLANTLRDLGQFDEAIDAYREAIRVQPGYLNAYTNLGSLFKQRGRPAEAAAVHREALRLQPDHAEGHYHLAAALAEQKMFAAAEASYRAALAAQADFVAARSGLLRVLTEQGKLDEALSVVPSLGADRETFENQFRLAEKLRLQRRFSEAAECVERVLQHADIPEAHNNLGLIRMSEGRLEEAVAAYRRALELRPDFADALSNLGVAFDFQKKDEAALRQFREALRIRPDFAIAHLNRAVIWLRRGDFEHGWQEFEWRRLCDHHRLQPMSAPLWLGQAVADGTVLLHAEQGLGDTIQFIRYAPSVKRRCGRVIAQCPAALARLLKRCPGIDELVSRDDALPSHDVQVPLMSLPRTLGTRLADVPADVPYVFADAALAEMWRQRLSRVQGFRVGIAWQGSADYGGDLFRSVPLRHFAPLAAVPGVKLVSLQKGLGAEQLLSLAGDFAVVDLGHDVDEANGPFMDTAAIMQNLDLVIASDTAIVHLAGAMGLPVWVLLADPADWRWLVDREDCPWYPTMRLFRQSQLGDWDELFVRVAAELAVISEE